MVDVYNTAMDKVALALTLLIACAAALIALLEIYFGAQVTGS